MSWSLLHYRPRSHLFFMPWSLQLYGPGQLIYVLVSEALYAWVSAALCFGRYSYIGLGLSCLCLLQLGLRQEGFFMKYRSENLFISHLTLLYNELKPLQRLLKTAIQASCLRDVL